MSVYKTYLFSQSELGRHWTFDRTDFSNKLLYYHNLADVWGVGLIRKFLVISVMISPTGYKTSNNNVEITPVSHT